MTHILGRRSRVPRTGLGTGRLVMRERRKHFRAGKVPAKLPLTFLRKWGVLRVGDENLAS